MRERGVVHRIYKTIGQCEQYMGIQKLLIILWASKTTSLEVGGIALPPF